MQGKAAVQTGPYKPPKPQAGGVAPRKETVLNSFYDFGSRAPQGLLRNAATDQNGKLLMGSDKYFKINEVNLPPKAINEMAKAKMEQKYARKEIDRIQNE
jgi:hypothetical protein